jgi:predicted DNA-binding protein
MPVKMTVVFHDEELYTELKVLAVRQRRTASDIVAEAVREWIASLEDDALLPLVKTREAEHREGGSRPWSEVESEWERAVSPRKTLPVVADKKRAQD